MLKGDFMGTYNPNEHPLITVVTSSSPLGKKYPKNNSYQPGVLYNGTFIVYLISSMQVLFNLTFAPKTK
jgi:hypothetical protein